MKLFTRASLFVLIVLTATSSSYSWEPFDRVIAVVNDRPIVESEIAGRLSRIQQRRNVPRNRLAYERSRLLDRFIEDSIVLQEAEQQSIVVSDEKVTNHIKKLMARMNIASMEDFKKRVEKVENVPFDEYRRTYASRSSPNRSCRSPSALRRLAEGGHGLVQRQQGQARLRGKRQTHTIRPKNASLAEENASSPRSTPCASACSAASPSNSWRLRTRKIPDQPERRGHRMDVARRARSLFRQPGFSR